MNTDDVLFLERFGETKEAFLLRMHLRSRKKLEELRDLGLFDFDPETLEAVEFPKILKLSELPPNPTTAHVAVALGIFPSITQARKNGWNEPLVPGEFEFTKKRKRVLIVD